MTWVTSSGGEGSVDLLVASELVIAACKTRSPLFGWTKEQTIRNLIIVCIVLLRWGGGRGATKSSSQNTTK